MINAVDELQAWQVEFPDMTGWEFRIGHGMVVVMAAHKSGDFHAQRISFCCSVDEYNRDAAFAEEHSVWRIIQANREARVA